MQRMNPWSIACAFAICVGLILIVASVASAQDAGAVDADVDPTYRPRIVPECLVYTLDDQREVCGYSTIEQVQSVYRADAELVFRRRQVTLLGEKIVLLGEQIDAFERIATARARAVELLAQRNNELTEALLERDRLYQNERVKPRWGSALAWTTAAVLGAILTGYIAADIFGGGGSDADSATLSDCLGGGRNGFRPAVGFASPCGRL